MSTEDCYSEIIKQYIDAEIDAESAMELMIQANGVDSSHYDPKVYQRAKSLHIITKRFLRHLFDTTTLTLTAGGFGLMLMFLINQFITGKAEAGDLVINTLRCSMCAEAVLIVIAFLAYVLQEVSDLHRMGIRMLSLDLFRLDDKEDD